ncbi:hypothetical protein OYT13_15985 [Pandoraea sp. XJJ-1]|uniref:hypothetical protein n=1 Tax=Pandoraea sp. XJJ-1 TaxID=3002643 RepID=UPI00227E8214|nr:hypothetical protein [Pandoraea sp. XJJ-1]WAL80996.1 hypothetical protein OYT13_14045 [Pandoraea sp. XJJ-1]WAL81351.1 hypothetical protein OYT13_15985 [Pandoraea sp. XJJ-1]
MSVRYCKDCKHYIEPRGLDRLTGMYGFCAHPKALDKVTGDATLRGGEVRMNESLCGPDGTLWVSIDEERKS